MKIRLSISYTQNDLGEPADKSTWKLSVFKNSQAQPQAMRAQWPIEKVKPKKKKKVKKALVPFSDADMEKIQAIMQNRRGESLPDMTVQQAQVWS